MAQRDKSTAKQHMTKRVRKHSQREGNQREVRRTFKMLREM